MAEILEKYQQVEVSMDDILIHADTIDKIKCWQADVIKTFKLAGVKLNAEKCIFNKKKLNF